MKPQKNRRSIGFVKPQRSPKPPPQQWTPRFKPATIEQWARYCYDAPDISNVARLWRYQSKGISAYYEELKDGTFQVFTENEECRGDQRTVESWIFDWYADELGEPKPPPPSANELIDFLLEHNTPALFEVLTLDADTNQAAQDLLYAANTDGDIEAAIAQIRETYRT